MRDFGERVRLVHELRELRRAEELLDRRDDRLGVDQVVRHRRVDVLMDRHLLLDGALHAHEADAELVLEQLADRADAAVAEVVDVVDAADVLAEAEQVVDDDEEVFGVIVFCVTGESRSSLMLNLKRPTREKSYLRASKNMPSKSALADSRVGGSPGRMRR